MKSLFLVITAMLFSITANAGFEDTREDVQMAIVHFATDKATLSSSAKAKLSKLKIVDASEIIIIGKTDSRGSDTYNVKLGMRRADSVMHYLNVNDASVSSVGKSEAKETMRDKMRLDRIAFVKVITPIVELHPLFGVAEPINGPTQHLQYNTVPVGQGTNRNTPRM